MTKIVMPKLRRLPFHRRVARYRKLSMDDINIGRYAFRECRDTLSHAGRHAA